MLPVFVVGHFISVVAKAYGAASTGDNIIRNWHELIQVVALVGAIFDEGEYDGLLRLHGHCSLARCQLRH